MKFSVNEAEIDRFLESGKTARIDCAFEGEATVAFTVDMFANVRERARASGWTASPRLVILEQPSRPALCSVLRQALEVEREYGYRSQVRVRADDTPPGLLRVEHYGVLEEISPGEGWVDIAATLTTGEMFMFTVETIPSLQAAMLEDGDPPGTYYCPDLLVVREIKPEIIEKALGALVERGIWEFGIRSNHDP